MATILVYPLTTIKTAHKQSTHEKNTYKLGTDKLGTDKQSAGQSLTQERLAQKKATEMAAFFVKSLTQLFTARFASAMIHSTIGG